MHLLIQAFPERPLTFVVMDKYGVNVDAKELDRQTVKFTNFAHDVNTSIAEWGIDHVIMYGPHDYATKLADYIKEENPQMEVKIVSVKGR